MSTFMKLRSVFLIALIFSMYGVLIEQATYPSLRFPTFPAKGAEGDVVPISVQLYAVESGREIDLMSVLQPYDKQYYLFAMRILADSSRAEPMLRFLNGLHGSHGHSDSLAVRRTLLPVR